MSNASPYCTTGPYFPVEWVDDASDLTRVAEVAAQGQAILITGTVVEAGGKPTRNTILEFWQADSNGIYRHPLDPCADSADSGFAGWGRARTNAAGEYRLRTILPGSFIENGVARQPHINVMVLALGLTRRLVTTLYFGNGADPVLDLVPVARRPLLIAQRDEALDADGALGYRFDIVLQGENETPFFLD
jgi:protocatechuate 3,4-dioxygenase alpha subunit